MCIYTGVKIYKKSHSYFMVIYKVNVNKQCWSWGAGSAVRGACSSSPVDPMLTLQSMSTAMYKDVYPQTHMSKITYKTL